MLDDIGHAIGVGVEAAKSPGEKLAIIAEHLVAPAEKELAKVAGEAVINAITAPDTAEDAASSPDLNARLLAEVRRANAQSLGETERASKSDQ